MVERFNSGMGGYTCDICHTLLWAGRDGKDNKKNRIYNYSHKATDIYETENGTYKFCKKCGPKDKSRRKER